MGQDHILIVDDDPQITSYLERYLVKQNYIVSCAASASEMDRILQKNKVDLCILDIGLPDKDGFEVTRDIRAKSNLPIVVLSGRDDPFDRVVGLEFGADDYMAKPFEARELLARIKSVLRRCKVEPLVEKETTETVPLLQFGNWLLNTRDRTLREQDTSHDMPITTTEFDLLYTMVKHPHTVLNRNQLLDNARGREAYPGDRTIDVHVMRLRKKIEPDPSNPIYIKTIHGIGYCFTANVTRTLQTPTGEQAAINAA
ncbi:response regulator [Flexibacterium corallicola]|uniref:response regulator n=1 Tax=Flexibacterium corallicola TaxID=3037259 RepID=UPI00286F4B96|nr:response regulator [Pseudovibrio sp. M1P-2-3]